MMTVGDEEGFTPHDVDDLVQDRRIRYGPELLPAALIVDEIDSRRLPFHGPFQQVQDRMLRIRIEQPDGTQIGFTGFEQVQSVALCRRSRIFVRIYMARIE